MTEEEFKTQVKKVSESIRVTKVVATRSIKGNRGDHFAGFSAVWDSTQDDGMQGMEELMENQEGYTLSDARIAHLLLAFQVEQSALEAALLAGSISPSQCDEQVRRAKQNRNTLLRNAAGLPAKRKE